jgi:hypothetical protein
MIRHPLKKKTIQWIPMFLLLLVKGPKNECDHSLHCVETKNAYSCTFITKHAFMNPIKRIDIRILVSYFRFSMTVEFDS